MNLIKEVYGMGEFLVDASNGKGVAVYMDG